MSRSLGKTLVDQIAIKAQGLSKHYRLGSSAGRQDTLRDHLMAGISSFRRRRAKDGQLWALRDVSFEIGEGEVVGIIGRNGAGKSTLLKILSRITRPTEGQAEIRGRLGSLLEVGAGFHWELTGRENIFLYGAILGMTRREIERRFDEIVAFSELERFLDTPVKRYSSGMYVRLAFAVAAHLDPDVLLVDEVLAVGDLAFQRKCLDHLDRLRRRGAAVLVVSHNMFMVKATCERVIYLAEGRVVANGTPEEAIDRYEREDRLAPAPWAVHALGTDVSGRLVQVTDVELRDGDGGVRAVFEHGERLRVRVRLLAREPVAQPNVSVSVFRSDDVPCCNYNTAMDGAAIPWVTGEATVELVTPPLKLVAASYRVQVMVYDAAFQTLYTAQMGPAFHVRHDSLNTHFGVFHEAAEWTWLTGARNGTASGKPLEARR